MLEGGVERKIMENNNNNPILPDELILQILLRLPIKSLLQFKCVCKSWLSLISDPTFSKSHFELVAAHTYRLLYLPGSGSKALSIDIDTSLDNDSLNYWLPTSYIGFNIRGSCRGFILLEKYPNLIVWNPSTDFSIPIPYSPIACATFYKDLYGFGYDTMTDDYLIVLQSIGYYEAKLISYWEFFSMRTNSWNEIEATNISYVFSGLQFGFLFNGAIHSMALQNGTSNGVIIVFDLIQRNLSQIFSPDGLINPHMGCLMEMGGCLSLCHYGDGYKTEIWVMKEYQVHSSWTKLFVVPDCAVIDNFNPLCSTKGGQIVAVSKRAKLVKLSGKGELLESRTCFDDRYVCKTVMYTETLLSLPNDHGEAR